MTIAHPLSYERARAHGGLTAWATAGTLAAFGLLTPNPWLTAASILVVPMFVRMLWRPGEPPVLLFLVSFQWLQVVTKVFHADVLGVSVDEMALTLGAPVGTAIWLSLTALVALALGQRLAISRTPPPPPEVLEQDEASLDVRRLFGIYAALFVASVGLLSVAFYFKPLTQITLALSNLKWVPLFALAYVVATRGSGRKWLGAAVAAEIFVGFGGYFSGFKTVFFVLIVAVLAAPRELTRSQKRLAAVSVVSLFALTLVWQGIKIEYRDYLNQGTASQVILVSRDQRIDQLSLLLGTLDGVKMGEAFNTGLERIAYVDMFSEVISYVPSNVAHTRGSIWLDALRHASTPRVIFQTKPILESDSEQSMRYTGLLLASTNEGTSISLGYAAESYVDFGYWGFWIPILIVGFIQGHIYIFFVKNNISIILGYGFALVSLLPGQHYETAVVNYLGGTLFAFIAYGVFIKLFGERVAGFVKVRAAPHAGRYRSVYS